MFSKQIYESDNSKDLINKLTNLTINDIWNNSNRATTSDVQVQFASDPSIISHQNLLSGRVIGIRQEEVPVLVPPKEPIIVAENQSDTNNRNGAIHAPQALKMPNMQELIVDTTL